MSIFLKGKDALDVEQAGGKGAALARLERDGFNPPAFFVIPNTAFRHGSKGPVAETGVKPAITSALKALGDGPYAVRSSGKSEDGADHSHAGQFDTVLNVAAKDITKAAAQVWQSGFSETVETYRAVKSGGAAEAPAIVVQKMVKARVSGVAFSADPVSGKRDRVVISAVEGYGDQLVAGEVDGQSWVLDASNRFVAKPDDDPVLSDPEIKAVAALARRSEQVFGSPQDIEWAMDEEGLHILQTRPITTPLKPLPNPDMSLTIFDNSNIVESYPGLVSPLTYSFATHVYARVYRAFVSLLGVRKGVVETNAALFDNMLGRIDGRVYYNLVNWYRALALLPGFSLNRAYMETMMGVDEPMPVEITENIGPPSATGLRKGLEYLRLVKVAGLLVFEAIRLPRTRAKFYDRLNAALHGDLDIASATATELANEYRHIESTLLDRWDAPLVNDFLCMIAFGASRNMLEKWLGPEGLTLHNDVMIGQGDIVSAEPAQRIAKIGAMVAEACAADDLRAGGLSALDPHPAIMGEIQGYLDKFGDRCTEELKLESIPLTEDPAQLLAAIAAQADRPPAPHTAPQDPDWKTLFKGRPLRGWIAKRVIGWTKARVRDRENLRFERTRIFGHARRVFLGIGREFVAHDLLDSPRDVFHLTKDEILGAVEGFGAAPDLKALVALRQAQDAAAALRPDPEARIEVRGPALLASTVEGVAPTKEETGDRRTATGCSAGTVTATARVIRDPRTESLTPGDILVARHTDPGWIAVFSNASAIVVERGSLLSHSAIVARELGIPCVVGLKRATDWIEDGQELSVNGSTGEVRKL